MDDMTHLLCTTYVCAIYGRSRFIGHNSLKICSSYWYKCFLHDVSTTSDPFTVQVLQTGILSCGPPDHFWKRQCCTLLVCHHMMWPACPRIEKLSRQGQKTIHHVTPFSRWWLSFALMHHICTYHLLSLNGR